MARQLDDWITSFIKYTENTESPRLYWFWSSLGIISAALQRRCYFQRGFTRIFPNQYIILVGPSGAARKGEPIMMARQFLDSLKLPMAPESTSREALIRRMKNGMSAYKTKKGRMIFQCPITIIAEELQVFLGITNTKFLADLTNMYDSRPTWDYETKHAGSDHIDGVCPTMIASTAPDWLPSMIPSEAVGGGFTSRCIFVVEKEKARTIPDPSLSAAQKVLDGKLKLDLKQIYKMEGEFRFAPDAFEIYQEWYVKQDKDLREGRSPVPHPQFGGYVSRRQTHVTKLGMVFSASRGNDMIISGEDFVRSLRLLEWAESKMHRAFLGFGTARFSQVTQAISNFIANRGGSRRSEVLLEFEKFIDSVDLDVIERTLKEQLLIKIELVPGKGDLIYEPTKLAVDRAVEDPMNELGDGILLPEPEQSEAS